MRVHHSVGLALAAAASLAVVSGVQAQGAKAADPATLNLSFVRLVVTDQPAMQAFYMKAFGLTVQKTIDNPQITEIILTNPKGLDLALLHYKDNRKITVGTADGGIGFYINDVDAAYKRAMAAGAVSRSAPAGGGPGVRVAVVVDPEGHAVELLHLD
jgi:lactoylglutathione lyase